MTIGPLGWRPCRFPVWSSGLTSPSCSFWRSTGCTAPPSSRCTTGTSTGGRAPRAGSRSCRSSPCSCRSSTRCTSSSGCSTPSRGIRYPRDRFQIQVLDDSTDETQEICKRKIADLGARFPELDVEYIHRTDRTGFKAGALHNGLQDAKGEFIMIFDADFVPTPDILERCIDHFTDPKVAVVQCRWEHVNRNYSALTEVQALMLDGHFIMEHAGPQLVGPLLQLQRHRRHVAAVGDRRRGRLAARHADRGHGPVVPGAAARLEVRLPARDRRARRAARRDVGVQVAAVPLGQGLGAGGEEAARDDPPFERDLGAEVGGVLPPDQQPRVPAAAGAVDPAAAEPGAAHAPRLARGADDRLPAVLRDDAVDRVVLPGVAARDRAAARSRREAALPVARARRGCR